MTRTATVRVGDVLALFDGKVFVSTDESIATLLNSALRAQRKGAHLWEHTYYPDEILGLAKDCAEHHGGELVYCDPQTYEGVPADALF